MIERFALLESDSFVAEKIPRPSLSLTLSHGKASLLQSSRLQLDRTSLEFGPAKRRIVWSFVKLFLSSIMD